MRGKFSKSLVIALVAIALGGAVLADVDDKSVVPHLSIGANLPQGDAADVLDDGWALHGGATWFRGDRPIGIRLDIGWDWWDISDDVLDQIDTTPATPFTISPPDDGDAEVWQGTVNFLWKPPQKGTVGFYLTGGPGVYWTHMDISEDGYATGYYCDWYYCYPGIYETDLIIEDRDSWEWGLNAGGAITFQLASGPQLYIEAIYHWLDTKETAEYIPVTFGVRW